MAWLRWQDGRQDSGYQKLLLFKCPLLFLCDLYLLRYFTGSYIGKHSDELIGYRHYRFNLIIWEADKGGKFICEKPIYLGKRLKVFRSDFPHQVSVIEKGTRYLVSFGLALKN